MLFFLLLIHSVRSNLLCPSCYWTVEIQERGETVSSLIERTEEPYLIESVNETVVKQLYDIDEAEGFQAYAYLLVFKCHNPSEDLQRWTNTLVESMVNPVIELCHSSISSNGMKGSLLCTEMRSMLVNQTEKCDDSICEPVWVTPLPMKNESLIIEGQIKTLSFGLNIAVQRYSLSICGYHQYKGQDFATANLSELRNSEGLRLIYLASMSPVLGLPLANYILLSNEDFRNGTAFFLEISHHLPEVIKNTDVCQCGNVPNTYAAVGTLSDRILLQTATGLYEILGSFSYNTNDTLPKAQRVFSTCTQGMELSVSSGSLQQLIILTGACQHAGEIYWASLLPRSGSAAEFEPFENETFCSYFQTHQSGQYGHFSACNIISVSASTSEKHLIIVLAQLQFPYNIFAYAIGKTNGSGWNLINFLPKTAYVKDDEDDPQLLNVINQEPISIQGKKSVELHLSGVVVMPWVSDQLLLWGNKLIKSADRGTHLYMYPLEYNITHFAVDRMGTFIFLTPSNKVFCGSLASNNIELLYPSTFWDILHESRGLAPVPEGGHVLTVFLNKRQQWHLLIMHMENVYAHPIPLGELLQLMRDSLDFTANPQLDLPFVENAPCPYVAIFIEIPWIRRFTKKQSHRFNEPLLSEEFKVHGEISSTLYSSVINTFNQQRREHEQRQYLNEYIRYIKKWDSIYRQKETYSIYEFQNEIHELQFSFKEYISILQGNEVLQSRYPKEFYLDKGQEMLFRVYLVQDASGGDTFQNLSNLKLSVLPYNDILAVQSQRFDYAENDTVVFEVSVKELETKPPYIDVVPASVQLSAWHASQQCMFYEDGNVEQQGVYNMDIMLGCPPQLKFIFNASEARRQSDEMMEKSFDCFFPDPDLPCFYYVNAFYPSFSVLDEATGESWEFDGNYTLNIIAGSLDGVTYENFTEKQRFDYNSIESPIPARIWIADENNNLGTTDGIAIFNSRNNRITWTCQPDSACAHILPRFPDLSPHYYFMVEFSNIGVGETTYCNFTMRFRVHVFGLELSATRMAVMLCLSAYGMICICLFIYYICHDRKNATTLKIQYAWSNFTTKCCEPFRRNGGEDGSGEPKPLGLDEWRRRVLPHLKANIESNDSDRATEGTQGRRELDMSDRSPEMSPFGSVIEEGDEEEELIQTTSNMHIDSQAVEPTEAGAVKKQTDKRSVDMDDDEYVEHYINKVLKSASNEYLTEVTKFSSDHKSKKKKVPTATLR